MQDFRNIIPVVKPIFGPAEQIASAPPVTLPNLPGMERIGSVKTVISQAGQRAMAIDAAPGPAGQNVMAKWAGPIPSTSGSSAPIEARSDSPQQALPKPPETAAAESYVRVEVHSENGQLSIVGVHQVPGPLVLPATVTPGYVYEALVGDQQVALGSLPDVGLTRSFANIDVPGPEGKHRVFPQPSFDFFVRIPQAQMTANTLPQLHIVLHKVTAAPDRLQPHVPLLKQPGVQAVQVATLPGIRLEALSPTVRPQMEKLLQR